MNGVDFAIIVLALAALIGILTYFHILKKKGRSIHCNCGKRHISGKKLVDEYHQANCPCCQGKSTPKK